MLINISNHPSERWGKDQKDATSQFGGVVDIPFPNIPAEIEVDFGSLEPELTYYDEQGESTCFAHPKTDVIHLMGEMTFTHYFVNKLQKLGFRVVSSVTERVAVEKDGKKISEFHFKGFRDYPKPEPQSVPARYLELEEKIEKIKEVLS